MNGHFYSNRNPVDWLRVCADIEHADPGDRFEEDFDRIFDDDKRETELDHPRYIEDQLDEDYDPYDAIGESRFGLPGGGDIQR